MTGLTRTKKFGIESRSGLNRKSRPGPRPARTKIPISTINNEWAGDWNLIFALLLTDNDDFGGNAEQPYEHDAYPEGAAQFCYPPPVISHRQHQQPMLFFYTDDGQHYYAGPDAEDSDAETDTEEQGVNPADTIWWC